MVKPSEMNTLCRAQKKTETIILKNPVRNFEYR